MKKVERKKTGITEISINKLLPDKNIRKKYGGIEGLARSIEREGLIHPIIVEQEEENYRIKCGHRRAKAYAFLLSEDKPLYATIPAIIKNVTSNTTVFQLIENIQRENLTPSEFEDALQNLIDEGMSQTEISKRLEIRLTRISDALAARKVRLGLEDQGVDTSEMSTSTVSAIRSLPEEDQKQAAEEIKQKGGTVKVAKEVVEKKKKPVYVKDEPEVIITGVETVNNLKKYDIPNGQIVIGKEAEKLLGDNELEITDGGKKLLQKIFPFIPVIVESPYKSNDTDTLRKNIEYAKLCCADCIMRGESPFASHLLFTRFLNEENERETGLAAAQAWYGFAEYCVVYIDNGITEGMQKGIDYMKSIGKKIVERKLNDDK